MYGVYVYVYTVYICACGMFGREITKYTVIYGVHIGIRFWPTLFNYKRVQAECLQASSIVEYRHHPYIRSIEK